MAYLSSALDFEAGGQVMPGTAARIQISEKQQLVLEEFSRSRTIAQCVVQRSTIILR